MGRADGRHLIEPTLAMKHPRAFQPEVAQDQGQGLDPLGSEDTYHLPLDQRRAA